MAQTASFHVLKLDSLDDLRKVDPANSKNKKSWFQRKRKLTHPVLDKLESLSVNKISFRYSGLAFAVLSVFSKEKLEAGWDDLEYSTIANELSQKTGAGIYIFSINDMQLLKLRPSEQFYSLEQLDQFAIEFVGNKPSNPDVMRKAVDVFTEALYKLANDRVVILLMKKH